MVYSYKLQTVHLKGHGLDDCIARIPSVAKVIFVALVAGEYCINHFI